MSPDHQPLAIAEDGEWRPGCECGWRYPLTFDLRAEAHAIAYRHDREQVAA